MSVSKIEISKDYKGPKVIQGFLQKSKNSRSLTAIFGAFQKRHFTLDMENILLYYGKSTTTKIKDCRIIDLEDLVHIKQHAVKNTTKNDHLKNSFALVCKSRNYTLICPNEDIYNLWIYAFSSFRQKFTGKGFIFENNFSNKEECKNEENEEDEEKISNKNSSLGESKTTLQKGNASTKLDEKKMVSQQNQVEKKPNSSQNPQELKTSTSTHQVKASPTDESKKDQNTNQNILNQKISNQNHSNANLAGNNNNLRDQVNKDVQDKKKIENATNQASAKNSIIPNLHQSANKKKEMIIIDTSELEKEYELKMQEENKKKMEQLAQSNNFQYSNDFNDHYQVSSTMGQKNAPEIKQNINESKTQIVHNQGKQQKDEKEIKQTISKKEQSAVSSDESSSFEWDEKGDQNNNNISSTAAHTKKEEISAKEKANACVEDWDDWDK